MIQIKDKKEKYRNTKTIRKAAFCGCGFSLNSKIFRKSLNRNKRIIRQNRKNRTRFLRGFNGGGRNE
jgi:hypothetical protein